VVRYAPLPKLSSNEDVNGGSLVSSLVGLRPMEQGAFIGEKD
jgi:hypothetical protein